MKTRLSLLLMIVLSIGMLGRTQDPATFSFTTIAWAGGTGAPLHSYENDAKPNSGNLIRDASATDKSLLWKVNLALHLVKRPELNQRQVRIILDAISLSSPELFATSSDAPARKAKADGALELLKRRADRAFPKREAADLFANIAVGKTEADILKMYYDISALPIKSRKYSFRNTSPNDKSDLWRTHLALFLVKSPDLNEWQKSVILSAMTLATPDFFAVRSSDAVWKTKVREPLRQLEQQVVNAFGFTDGARIFATLGDDAETAKTGSSVLLKTINYTPLGDSRAFKWMEIQDQEMMLERPNCQCSTDSDWCHMTSSCNGSNCTATDSGCGSLWSYPCNGASCQ